MPEVFSLILKLLENLHQHCVSEISIIYKIIYKVTRNLVCCKLITISDLPSCRNGEQCTIPSRFWHWVDEASFPTNPYTNSLISLIQHRAVFSASTSKLTIDVAWHSSKSDEVVNYRDTCICSPTSCLFAPLSERTLCREYSDLWFCIVLKSRWTVFGSWNECRFWNIKV